ncbi:acetyl-CoA carboxylase biotin carboxyl carrier protein [Candidatus Pantoea edessiphila]|uniref:Biotin carboxyl carrier protein of acetyl-CoA carboxylase n=1 Tax=Candidatus Pantoea edessiphila TaxID=2044610 RepID=A0A2P5SVT4_9GAMM|nr:acetyl-CoA carboxylase biotin carboxyl carrier protein [Candidatus Pantoea edessiphila]PPI86431.1 acetyl-CoA carboxylase, biotin carboxyl carrier protein [Candidatus Pantoea edessiphila]
MDIRKIKKLIELTEKYNISKLKISGKTESISICRHSDFTINQKQLSNTNTPINYQNTIKSKQLDLSKLDNQQITHNNNYIVRSPMVGVFYRTLSPAAKTFIEIGQKINKGDILCIVEAMKMMNQIAAETSGIVKAILAENGHPVEFNEPLMIIEY